MSEREWAVSHVFEQPPSPVVLRCSDEEHARAFARRCVISLDRPRCVVVHRDSPQDEWSE